MVFKTDKSYTETKLIKQGKAKMNPDFERLADFIEGQSGVRPLNIFYDFLDETTPRLEVIFEFYADESRFWNSPDFKETIVNKFDELVNLDARKGCFFSLFSSKKPIYPIDSLFAVISSFERVALSETFESLPNEIHLQFKKVIKIPEIWEVVRGVSWGYYIMFYTEKQAKHFEEQGLKSEINKQLISLIESYDKLGYLSKRKDLISFDSKENFDKNYESNWYYFFK